MEYDPQEFQVIDFPYGAFLAYRRNADEKALREMVLYPDVGVFDLDHSVADSPLENCAFSDLLDLLTLKNVDPRFIGWVLKSAYRLSLDAMSGEEKGKVDSAKEYIDFFLNDKLAVGREERKRKGKKIEDIVERLVYRGVEKFCNETLSFVPKWFITRNINELTAPFVEYLGFEGMITEVRDRDEKIREFIEKNRRFKYYVKVGDFEVMPSLKVFDQYLDEGKIKSMVSINVARSKSGIDQRAKITIGRDFRGLNEWLSG